MLIAQQKQSENIAEYILYMYQIEDIVRAFNFDLANIIEQVVRPQLPDDSYLNEYKKWYARIITDLSVNGKEKIGHTNDLTEIMVELSYLHQTLLNLQKEVKYKTLYEASKPYLDEFKQKSNLKDKNDVELAFAAMYMKLLLKLQKKEISAESEEAFDSMRIMIAYLARYYQKMKTGDIDFLTNG